MLKHEICHVNRTDRQQRPIRSGFFALQYSHVYSTDYSTSTLVLLYGAASTFDCAPRSKIETTPVRVTRRWAAA